VRGQDVQNQDGLWVLRITPEAGAVKGRRARVVPIHDHLVEQGFVAFAEAQGDGPLFYDPNGRRNDVSDPFKPIRAPWVKAREKLAEWVRSLGVTDPNISPVHAWRHTFKRRVGAEPASSGMFATRFVGTSFGMSVTNTKHRPWRTWPSLCASFQGTN